MGAGVESAAAEPFDNRDLAQTEESAWPDQSEEQILNSEEAEEAIPLSVGRPVLAGLLILLAVAWLVTAGIVLYRTWDGANLVSLASWVATLCLPLALLALVWLVFGRTSRAETEKFTRAVAEMRREALSLDEVLANVAERLSANRTQLGDETARLMKLGEEASDRLGRVTHYLSRETAGLKARSDAVESAAAQARVDLGVLLTDLPQAEQSARSLSEAMRDAGVTAHERARALEAQLSAITARAQDADTATGGAAERLSAHISRIESSAVVAAGQLDGAAARMDSAVDGALGRTSEAVEATRVALETQAQAMLGAIDQHRGRLADAGADASRSLAQRIEEMHEALTAKAQGLFGLVDESQARFTAASEAASGDFQQRQAAMQSALAEQAGNLVALLDDSQARFAAAGEAASGELQQRQVATQAAVAEQARVLARLLDESRERFSTAGAEASAQLRERQGAMEAALAEHVRQLTSLLEESQARLTTAGDEAGGGLRQRVEETRAALAEQARELFAHLEESQSRIVIASDQADAGMRGRLQEVRTALAEQAQQLFAQIDESRARFTAAAADTGGELTGRLEAARQLVELISAGIVTQEETSQRLIAGLGSQVAALDERLTAVGQRSEGQSAQMSTALAGLREATATLRQEVDASTQEAVALVGRAQDMAGALDAVGERLRFELPPVMAEVEARAAAMRDTALAAVEPVQALRDAAAEGTTRLGEAEQLVARSRTSLEELLAGIDGGVAQIDQRLRELAGAATQADDAASLLVRETGPELVEALVRVREAARAAATHAREAITAVIPESADNLAQAAQQALSDTIEVTVRQQIGELESSSQRAAAAARKASERLTRQLLTLGESAAALEAKVAEERVLRDEQERDAMPRRVALLIESLNSTAIDVTKILSNDVTDTAWQAYLKGDRGVFTRRAVRLLDSGEAREIQRHYDNEPEFREQVNRYIGDFEAMLRRILVDGEGNTLAITILSSDMGKLYVALAQAINHLRV